jgi:hypothetical protein
MKNKKLSQELNGNNKREKFKEEKCFHVVSQDITIW